MALLAIGYWLWVNQQTSKGGLLIALKLEYAILIPLLLIKFFTLLLVFRNSQLGNKIAPNCRIYKINLHNSKKNRTFAGLTKITLRAHNASSLCTQRQPR